MNYHVICDVRELEKDLSIKIEGREKKKIGKGLASPFFLEKTKG
jgi:hypothetical protein